MRNGTGANISGLLACAAFEIGLALPVRQPDLKFDIEPTPSTELVTLGPMASDDQQLQRFLGLAIAAHKNGHDKLARKLLDSALERVAEPAALAPQQKQARPNQADS